MKSKKLDVKSYSRHLNNLTMHGEMIKTRQDEKQSVMDDFDKQKKSFRSGKISEASVTSTAKKVNTELRKLNKEISDSMSSVRSTARQLLKLTSRQNPIYLIASTSGIKSGSSSKKRKSSRKKK